MAGELNVMAGVALPVRAPAPFPEVATAAVATASTATTRTRRRRNTADSLPFGGRDGADRPARRGAAGRAAKRVPGDGPPQTRRERELQVAPEVPELREEAPVERGLEGGRAARASRPGLR